MSLFDLHRKNSALFARQTQVETSVIGLVERREFEQARAAIPELAGYADYSDWLDSREGLQIGLSMAGDDAVTACVSLSSFLEWRDLTGASSDLPALDAFAALAFAVRKTRVSKVLAFVSATDFATHALEVAAFAGHSDYHGWMRHRQAARADALAAGLRVEELPVRVGGFVEWCACLRQRACEGALDRYARLLLEHLTSDGLQSD